MHGERVCTEWGSLSPCDCLDVTVCCVTVTSLVITNLCLHLAACGTTALHTSDCAGSTSSPFLNLAINILHIQVVPLESHRPDLGIRQDLRDVPGMLTQLTGPKDSPVTPPLLLKVC